MRVEVKAYIAGIMDGEGCFQIRRAKDKNMVNGYRFSLGFRITSTNKEVLEFVKYYFGGNIGEHKLNNNKGKWKKAWRYDITCKKAFNLLQNIYPYLIIKEKQANVMVKFQKTITNNTKPIPEELWEKRKNLKLEINKLNKRGL